MEGSMAESLVAISTDRESQPVMLQLAQGELANHVKVPFVQNT